MTQEKNQIPSIEQALVVLDAELTLLSTNPSSDLLTGISADTAFELGYASAIFDLRKLTRPNTFEVTLVSLSIPPVPDENKNSETSS